MPENIVLFHIRGSPWTLGGVCLVIAAVLLVAWICLLPSMIARTGTVRRMSTEEAQRRSVLGRPPQHDAGARVIGAGPAAGVQWSYSLTIGSLRTMRQHGDYFMFYALPAYAAMLARATMFGGVGFALLTRAWLFLVFTGFALLFNLLLLFMMWASVNTQLE